MLTTPAGLLPDEQQIRTCLPDHENAGTQLLLTTHHLHILQDNKATVYQLSGIHHIETRHIRIMGYYLSGGMLAAISILAMTNDLLAPIYGVIAAMLGSFLFYIGWKGKNMLMLVLLNGSETKWFSGDHQLVLQFTNHFNYYLGQYRQLSASETSSV